MSVWITLMTVLLSGTPERIIDADTLDLDGTRIRLWGIQAPERGDVCAIGLARFRCDDVARAWVGVLAADGLACAVKDTDRYGRAVALCRNTDGVDIGRALVSTGYALAYRRFSRDYVGEEDLAREQGRGWWNCQVWAPPAWERRKAC